MRILGSFLLTAAALGAQSAGVDLTLIKEAVIQDRLQMVSRKLAERRATLQKLFRDAGCAGESLTTQLVRGSAEPNLICTLRGTDPSAGTIVVGSHFDFVAAGTGAIDNWSGSALLPSLYETLKAEPRRHDYVFIAFAAEEKGLVGSKTYVNKLTHEEHRSIRAMINLECLGLTPPKVWVSRADPHLLEAYARSASALHIPLGAVNVDKVGDDDAHSFHDAGIATLTIHSINPQNFPLLHSSKDKVTAIGLKDYYDSYRVAALLLTYLDGVKTL